jgi:hypothetical protein
MAMGERRIFLFNNYYKKGLQKEAMQEMAACWRLFGHTEGAARIERALSVSGPRAAVQEWAKGLEELQAAHKIFLPGNLVVAYTILGDKDRAFYWLEQAYEHREMVSADGGDFFLGSEPMYDPLRSDPRFKDLMRRVGCRSKVPSRKQKSISFRRTPRVRSSTVSTRRQLEPLRLSTREKLMLPPEHGACDHSFGTRINPPASATWDGNRSQNCSMGSAQSQP